MSSSAAALGSAGAAQAAAAGLVLFGACRALSGVAKELQGPVFAPVSQVGAWFVLGTRAIQLRRLQRRAWGAGIEQSCTVRVQLPVLKQATGPFSGRAASTGVSLPPSLSLTTH